MYVLLLFLCVSSGYGYKGHVAGQTNGALYDVSLVYTHAGSTAALIPIRYTGDPCTKDGQLGVCRNIQKCESEAIRGIATGSPPMICSMQKKVPVVCCFESTTTVTTSSTTRHTTTIAAKTTEDSSVRVSSDDDCKPILPELTVQKNGRKAWDKCIEYQEKYVYPCKNSAALVGGRVREYHCEHKVDELVVGGEDAKPHEFPHMALLGYGDIPALAQWSCGGSVISERYVLTAGHCTFTRDNVKVSYVRTNLLSRSEPLDEKYLYKVARIIKHPDYHSPILYNDIALLETDTDMRLSRFVYPACLPTDSSLNDSKAMAIGFGALEFRGKNSEKLQKVNLTKFSTDDCDELYEQNRRLSEGVDGVTQLCFGDKNVPRDTCQGDSGGPLQIGNKNVRCTYTIVGVTSYGASCGKLALYTKVLHYTPWIEEVVWPN